MRHAGGRLSGGRSIDVLQGRVGAMDPDLDWAIARTLECERAACANYARGFSWERGARQFLAALAPVEQCMAAWPLPSCFAALPGLHRAHASAAP